MHQKDLKMEHRAVSPVPHDYFVHRQLNTVYRDCEIQRTIGPVQCFLARSSKFYWTFVQKIFLCNTQDKAGNRVG